MDPSLIREREAFLKRARTMPVIEVPRAPAVVALPPTEAASVTSRRPIAEFRLSDSRPQNQGRFAVLSRIVKYMKQRHLDHDVHPLSVEELLEEAMLQDTNPATIRWLEEEALPNNPKIKSFPDKKYAFKPKYDIKNRHDLYHLLRRHDSKGLGGIYLDDVAEGIADVDKVVASLGDHVISVPIPHEKKMVLFYNDKSFDLNIDEEFKAQWRGVSVEGVHETKIEEYLRGKGIASMSADRRTFTPVSRARRSWDRRARTARPVRLKHNEHLSNVLQDFSEPTNKR